MDRYKTLLSMHEAMRTHFGRPDVARQRSPFAAALTVLLAQGGKRRAADAIVSSLEVRAPLTPLGLARLSRASFESLFQPLKKAGPVSGLLAFLAAFFDDGEIPPDADLAFLAKASDEDVREGLTAVRGIGAETADAVLLYALDRPVFVTSAGIYRILRRHGMVFEDVEQQELREFFTDVLPEDPTLFKEMHDLFGQTARAFCKTAAPACRGCPLKPFLEYDPVE